MTQEFPVTVDPKREIISENEQVNAFLADEHSLFGASVASVGGVIQDIFVWLATSLADLPWYQNLANVTERFVTITPGMRKEQVATAFAKTLGWTSKQKQKFLTPLTGASLPLTEGSFAPGLYAVAKGMAPEDAQKLVNERFSADVLAHYSTSTQAVVPLNEALTIASLIQRETITTDGMRLLSGIMWNRIFADMNLQVDATLQYAKANNKSVSNWWPTVYPRDKYIKSPYNTYQNSGLPPAPIANPSVASILAALNPIKTDCLFYFNDKKGNFHCSKTYAEHKKQIDKYY